MPEEIFRKENIGGFGREGSLPAGSWGVLMEKLASGESLMDRKALDRGCGRTLSRVEQIEPQQRTAGTSTWLDMKMKSGKGGWTVEGPRGRSWFSL